MCSWCDVLLAQPPAEPNSHRRLTSILNSDQNQPGFTSSAALHHSKLANFCRKMSLQHLIPVNCASLLQPGSSLMLLEGDTYLFGQKGWPKRSCPTGIFSVRIKHGELKLRAISFSNNSCYLPPLRYPAIAHLEPDNKNPECYLIHGGRTPNNELSSSLYILSVDNRGCNRKVILRCQEKELVGELPDARYGHTLSVVHSRGKTACVLFGGRSYMSSAERTTENWNCMVDCIPQIYIIELEFGCCSAHTVPELTDGQSFHLALAREDCVYFLGGHIASTDCRPPRLFKLRVELFLGSPLLSCEILNNGFSITSAIATPIGNANKYIILGGYQSDSEKRMLCTYITLDDVGIHIEPREPPEWSSEISQSRTWFGGTIEKGSALVIIPSGANPSSTDSYYCYQLSFQQEGDGDKAEEDQTQTCSQGSTDFEDSAPLEDSEELYFGREPHELDYSSDGEGDTYNEEDEEDVSQTGYWIKCCLSCQVDINTWEPFYSTELTRPAMIFCSRGEGGHWVHAQCMELSESLLLRLSQDNSKYYCLDHGGLARQEMTPERKTIPLKRVPMKTMHRKTPITLKMTPVKKSFFRRLFD